MDDRADEQAGARKASTGPATLSTTWDHVGAGPPRWSSAPTEGQEGRLVDPARGVALADRASRRMRWMQRRVGGVEALASTATMMPGGPAMIPAIGRTEKAPLGAAATPRATPPEGAAAGEGGRAEEDPPHAGDEERTDHLMGPRAPRRRTAPSRRRSRATGPAGRPASPPAASAPTGSLPGRSGPRRRRPRASAPMPLPRARSAAATAGSVAGRRCGGWGAVGTVARMDRWVPAPPRATGAR